MRPERIVILGNAGSGKSTLSRMLGEKLGYSVTHLDKLFWDPGWIKPDPEAFRQKVKDATNAPVWITEGNYARRTFDLRLPEADLVIWLNTPRILCLIRVFIRSLGNKKRPDLPEGCTEKINYAFFKFLRYVWDFDKKYRPEIERLRIESGGNVPVIYLNNKNQLQYFLANLSES
ncbi:hypothetical protein WIA93_24610 [Citrobacter amalonaticus]|uniref:hypothetical protein n=1 Tax=Citrobacter amalonaticus TaxID=35703 RepID=UPI00339C4906